MITRDRRTKIICTLGPASNSPETIQDLIEAGMDVARINFSHGEVEEHRRTIQRVRAAAENMGRPVSVLQDLQGPKIRVGDVADGCVQIEKGQQFVLTDSDTSTGTAKRVYVDYDRLTEDVEPGDRILLDDGLIELQVTQVADSEVVTQVVVGGPLRSRKGVNFPQSRTTMPSMTEKDRDDLALGMDVGVDLVALSFVRREEDVVHLREELDKYEGSPGVIAKIEKPEAVEGIDSIVSVSDGIMVARGDLGIEMPLARVPDTQKRIILTCLKAAKPVITATQMLESMIDNPRPTRAEASDVANAVLDGSDAVMLSGETAIGEFPIRVVNVMNEIIHVTEENEQNLIRFPRLTMDRVPQREQVTEAISYTACQLAEEIDSAAIACLTHSGATARAIARHRPSVPIFAFTDNDEVVGRLSVLWGTDCFTIPFEGPTDAGIEMVHRVLKQENLVSSGDHVVFTAGMPLPKMHRTNMVHVSRIE